MKTPIYRAQINLMLSITMAGGYQQCYQQAASPNKSYCNQSDGSNSCQIGS